MNREEFTEFVKENLLLLIENYEENIKDKKPIEIDTEKFTLVEQYTTVLADKVEEISDEFKIDIINEVLEKIEEMRYEVENL